MFAQSQIDRILKVLSRSDGSRGEIVDALYRVILGRDADVEGRETYAAALDNGATVEELARILLSSKEFEDSGGFEALAVRFGLSRNSASDHPLAPWSWLYTPENAPYFSHKGLFRPVMIIIETVNICNNACVICPYSIHTRKKETMSLELFQSIVTNYAEIGGGHVSLTPMLGEVLLDKFLRQRLDILHSNKLIQGVSASTNVVMAKRYSDNDLNYILSKFRRIYVSVYGFDDEEYELMTKEAEYREMREQLIRILKLAPEGTVVLGLRNLRRRSQEEQTEWADELGREASTAAPPILSTGDEYLHWGDLQQAVPLPLDGKWRERTKNTQQCLIPLSALQILADGTVSFCSCADYNANEALRIGNVRETRLEDLLRGEKYKRLWNWRECGVPEFCRECGFHKPMTEGLNSSWTLNEPLNIVGG